MVIKEDGKTLALCWTCSQGKRSVVVVRDLRYSFSTKMYLDTFYNNKLSSFAGE